MKISLDNKNMNSFTNSSHNYYEILGIGNNYTNDQIQKAYVKLTLRWHPDRNQERIAEAEIKFREIREAFVILSDPNKRRIYDEYGFEGLKTRNLLE